MPVAVCPCLVPIPGFHRYTHLYLAMANGASYTSIASGTTYYTAQTHYDSHTTVSTAFYSVQDPAVVHVNSLSDFQQQFRELDISSSISNVAEQPSGRGASADVRQADLNVPPGVVRVRLLSLRGIFWLIRVRLGSSQNTQGHARRCICSQSTLSGGLE